MAGDRLRRWLAGAVLLALGVALVGPGEARTRARFYQTDCTSTLQGVVPGRAQPTRTVTLFNAGTANVYINSDSSHTAATTATGFTLHAGASLEFQNFGGQLNCLTDGPGQRLNVIEETD